MSPRPEPPQAGTRRPLSRRGRAWGTLVIVTVVMAIVIVPVATLEVPREIARWHVAAAAEHALNGDYPAAIEQMDQAVAWDPSNAAWLLLRAEYKQETRQWQSGLDDCDQARQLLGGDAVVGELRSQFLHHLGRHQDAVNEWRNILILRQGGTPSLAVEQQWLNGLAYATAIGSSDLDEGRLAAEKALQIVANVPAIRDPRSVLDFGRAVTAQELEQPAEALQYATLAVDSAEAAWQRASRRAAEVEESDPLAVEKRSEEKAMRAHLAGILEFRAKLYEAQDLAEEGQKDRRRKEELMSAGNLTEVLPYGLEVALDRVESCANVLDTRGFVLFRLGMFDEALDDLDCALAAYTQVDLALPSFVEARKHLIIDMRQEMRNEQLVRRTLAVISYHRSLVLEALGKRPEAEQDRKKVRDLGYEPDDHLF